MGMNYKTVGGSGTGIGTDFATFLQQGLNTGTFGGGNATSTFNASNPVGSTQGMAGILNDILSGGAGKLGGSLSEMISKQGERDVAGLRSRFGVGGGTAFGTPAQYSEALLRSETAPKLTQAVGGLQTNLLASLLPIFAGIAGKDIPQAETVGQQNPWLQAAGIALPLAGTALGMMAGGPGGAAMGSQIGSQIGSGFNTMPQTNTFPQFTPQMWNPQMLSGQGGYASGGNGFMPVMPQWQPSKWMLP